MHDNQPFFCAERISENNIVNERQEKEVSRKGKPDAGHGRTVFRVVNAGFKHRVRIHAPDKNGDTKYYKRREKEWLIWFFKYDLFHKPAAFITNQKYTRSMPLSVTVVSGPHDVGHLG
jgi:hypothetical protein